MGEGKRDVRFPVFDKKEGYWKLETEWGTEVGDALYIASEFVKTGLFYKYKVNGELTLLGLTLEITWHIHLMI